MTFANLKSPVLLTLLGVFATGWLALYWIMAGQVAGAQDRITEAQNNAIALHGQQETELQAQGEKFAEISETLGTLRERSKNQSKILTDQAKTLKEINTAIQTMNNTLIELKAK